MELLPSKAPKDRPKRGFWGVVQWIFLWGTMFGLSGVALVAVTNKAVIWSSSDAFCGTFCHTMTWSSAAYHQGPHFINAAGVRASCGQCHIPYDSSHATATEYVKLLLFKADRGAKDFWNESRKTIATKEEWETERPQLRTEFESYTRAHNYITCRGCHSLEAFGGPRSRMKALMHKDLIKANTFDCFQCHQDVGHVYGQPVAKVGGWYTVEQAAAGSWTSPDISASTGDLLSASVPSRSNTISFFTILPPSEGFGSQSGSATSNKFTALWGRKVHAPITAGKRNTSPFPTA